MNKSVGLGQSHRTHTQPSRPKPRVAYVSMSHIGQSMTLLAAHQRTRIWGQWPEACPRDSPFFAFWAGKKKKKKPIDRSGPLIMSQKDETRMHKRKKREQSALQLHGCVLLERYSEKFPLRDRARPRPEWRPAGQCHHCRVGDCWRRWHHE